MRKLRVTEMGRMNAEQYKASAKTPLVLVLDDVRSMYNVGSLFRTADCFRLAGMALCGITACPPHTEIHKTALGAEMTVDWQYFPTALQAVSYLKGRGYHVFSLEQTVGSIALQDFRTVSTERYALVLGNEVKGVAQEVVDASEGTIEIPQFGTKHSFNVSVSAGIAIWQIAKQLMGL